jgi:hypothetical protein
MAYVAADTAVNEVYVNDDRHFSTAWVYNAGYTQYDLFGTSASLTAIVSYQNRKIRGIPRFDNDLKWRARYDLSYQIVAVAPVAANQSITASWGWHIDPFTVAGPQGQFTPLHTRPIHLNSQQLAWRYDTTDDPLFPTTGTLLRAGGIRDQFAYVDNSSSRQKKYNHHEQAGVERFWSLTPLQSISAGIDYEQFGAETYRPHIGWSTSLWSRDRTLRLGDMRAEAELDRFVVDPFSSRRGSSSNLRLGVAFRNTWGVVRANFQYSGWSSR